MNTLLEIAKVAVPAATAGGGAWWGAHFQFRRERRADLARVVREGVRVLERADQQRGRTWYCVGAITDDPETRQEAQAALSAFRTELSEAAQLRGELLLHTASTSILYQHFHDALEALGRLSVGFGVALMQTPDARAATALERHQKETRDTEAFETERTRFADAARWRLG